MAYRTTNPLTRYNYTGAGYGGAGDITAGLSTIAQAMLAGPALQQQALDAAAAREAAAATAAKTGVETEALRAQARGRGSIADLYAAYPELLAGVDAKANLDGVEGWMAASGAQGVAADTRGRSRAGLEAMPARIASAAASLPAVEQGQVADMFRFVQANSPTSDDATYRAVVGAGGLPGLDNGMSVAGQDRIRDVNQANAMEKETFIQDATTERNREDIASREGIAGMEEGGRNKRFAAELAQALGISEAELAQGLEIAHMEEAGRDSRNAVDNSTRVQIADSDNATSMRNNDETNRTSRANNSDTVLNAYRMNAEDNSQSNTNNQRDNETRVTTQEMQGTSAAEVARISHGGGEKVSAGDTGRIDGEIDAQTGGFPLDADSKTRIRAATEKKMQSGVAMANAVSQSLEEAGAERVGGGNWFVSNRTNLAAPGSAAEAVTAPAAASAPAATPQAKAAPPQEKFITPDGLVFIKRPDGKYEQVVE